MEIIKKQRRRERFTCNWIFEKPVILCDGTVICGCNDPLGARPLGNIKDQPLKEIWNTEIVQRVRRQLNGGYSDFCKNCCLRTTIDEETIIEKRPVVAETIPEVFIEPTIICNLNCYKSICGAGSGIEKSRLNTHFSMEDLEIVLSQTGSELRRINLFNYGEPFVNKEAVDMIEYIKGNYPHIFLFTSTNANMLNEEKIRRIIDAGMDEITFSIDGCDQKSYGRYRRGGKFEKTIQNMKTLIEMRNSRNLEVPFVNWRYILFKFNDSDKQMKKAVEMAEEIGVDRFTWEITDTPPQAKSRKYQVGTRGWKKIYNELWDTGDMSNAIKSKKYRAEISSVNKKKMDIYVPDLIEVAVENTGTEEWLTKYQTVEEKGFVRLGLQLFDKKGRLVNLDYSRADISKAVKPGEKEVFEIMCPQLSRSGKYRLKLDMVIEGVGWFENSGSEVMWIDLEVKGDREHNGKVPGYSAGIRVADKVYELESGTAGRFGVLVENKGTIPWLNVTRSKIGWIRLGTQLYDHNRKLLDMNYSRTFISRIIRSGDNDLLNVDIPAIKEPGSYYIKLDMVSEGVLWFEDAGSDIQWIELKVKEKALQQDSIA